MCTVLNPRLSPSQARTLTSLASEGYLLLANPDQHHQLSFTLKSWPTSKFSRHPLLRGSWPVSSQTRGEPKATWMPRAEAPRDQLLPRLLGVDGDSQCNPLYEARNKPHTYNYKEI